MRTGDPIDVALANLRRGGKDLLEAQLHTAAVARRTPPSEARSDSAHLSALTNANRLEAHIAREQAEREEAAAAAIAAEARRRGRAGWRPTAFLGGFEKWREDGGEPWLHAGTPLPGRIGPFSFMSPHEFRAAVVTTSGYPEQVFRQPGYEPSPGPRLGLVSAIDWLPTEFEQAQYMLEGTMSVVATETAEGAAAPEASLAYTPSTTYTKRLSVVLPASRQVLDDTPQLEALLSSRLVYEIMVRLQGQVIAGNGSPGAMAGNLCGILNTPNVLSVSKVTVGTPLQPQVDAIAAAIAAIRVATLSWYEPDSLVIHPSDAEELAQAKDTAGRYIFPVGEPLAPFGLKATITSSASVGAPLVGASGALQGYVRDALTVDISDSHSDFFTRRLVMLRAEGRFGFCVRNPLAWCQIANFDA